jgi:hypothetical protein
MKPRAEHEENEENLSLQSGGSRIRSASTHTIEKKTDKQRQNQAITGGGLSGKIQSQAKFRKIGQALYQMKQLHMHMREQNWWRQLQFQWRKEKSSSWNKYPSENSRGESRKRSRRRPILGPDHDLVARLSENGHPLTRGLEDSRAENQPAHTASEQEKPDQAGAVKWKTGNAFNS